MIALSPEEFRDDLSLADGLPVEWMQALDDEPLAAAERLARGGLVPPPMTMVSHTFYQNRLFVRWLNC